MRIRNVNYTISWARLVSDLFSPPVVWAVFAFPIALHDAPTRQQAVVWAVTYIFLVCILPVFYIALMVRRGHITDIHMQVRRQRIRPLLVSVGCTAVAWGILRLMGAPSVVPTFAIFSLIQLAVMMVITIWWQISIHAISITGVAVATGALFGLLPALLTLPLIVLVGAARLKLKRHTVGQVVGGTVIGAAIPMLLFLFIAFP